MPTLDHKKELKHLYAPSAKEVVAVNVPTMNFLMIDGQGDPNTSKTYTEAIDALFSVSYTAKFMLKKGPSAIDYAVMPLESLWWADDPAAFTAGRKDDWHWTAMIMQPSCVTRKLIKSAIDAAAEKKDIPALPLMRFESFNEGTCAQILHIGPFTEEGPTIAKVHQFIASAGKKLADKHHEIYLSDIRRAAPAKWKTIVRQPMK